MAEKQNRDDRGKAEQRPVRPRGGRPTFRQSEELYDRILDAAVELFTTQGYGETSIEAIATRAGVGKLTLYRRFHDKETLFQAVALRLSESRRGELAGLAEQDGTLAEVLTTTGTHLLDVALSPQSVAFHRILFAEWARLPELAARMYLDAPSDNYATGQAPLHAIFRRFAGRGGFRIEDVPFLEQQFIQCIIARPLQLALLGREGMSVQEREEHVRRTVDLFLRGAAR